jgi:hypothetical protein
VPHNRLEMRRANRSLEHSPKQAVPLPVIADATTG